METKALPEGTEKYQVEAWLGQFGSWPIERIAHEDKSESYEMNAAHVFRLEDGKFALVTECGCSCYESADAGIDLYPTEEAALAAFEKWQKGE